MSADAMLEHALAVARRGLRTFPCHSIVDGECTCREVCDSPGKHPRVKSWREVATTDEEQIRMWWSKWPDANPAVATGLGSGCFAVDIDPRNDGFDAIEQLIATHDSLPPTFAVTTGGDGAHLFYKHPVGDLKWRKQIANGIDIQGEGRYVIAAGALHASGKRYEIEVDLPITEAPAWLIEMATRSGVAIAPSATPWTPIEHGARLPELHDYARHIVDKHEPAVEGEGGSTPTLVVAILLYKGLGLPDDGDTRAIYDRYLQRCTPPWSDEAQIRHKIESAKQSDKRLGFKLGEFKVWRWMRRRSKQLSVSARAAIDLDPNLAKMTDDVAAALASRPDANLYQRSGLLVRLVDVKRAAGVDTNERGVLGADGIRRPEGAPVIQLAPIAAVHETVSRLCCFTKKKKDKTVEVSAPRNVVDMFAARGSWELPILELVAESPRMRSDGTVIQTPGLDVPTAVYYRPVVDYPLVPEAPTRDDALAALELLKYPLIDFPFVEEHYRSAALAAMLTVAAGPRVAGPRPMFEVGASTPGDGKGKLVNVISIISNGRPPACMSPPKDEDESRKTILSLALDGTQVILLDNATGLVGTPSLAMALTAGEIRGRVLGLSRIATVPINATWFITGNNISFSADLARRVVPIALDAGVEHPEDRTGWHEPDLIGYCMRERPRLAVAALTILRAHAVAGQPPHGAARKGSFESWDDVVRSALIWLGCADPLGGVAELREHADGDRDAIAEFMTAWHDAFGDKKIAAGDVVTKAEERPFNKLRTALMAFAGATDAAKLGFKLREVKGRLVGGRRFLVAGKVHGRTSWSLVVAR